MDVREPEANRLKDYDLKFRTDLAYGKEGESQIVKLFGNSSIEVKRDKWVSRSGNVAIEVECSGRPSGIMTTKAEWWCFILGGGVFSDEVIFFIKTARLKKMVEHLAKKYPSLIRSGGDGDRARFMTVQTDALFRLSLHQTLKEMP